ncbi:MAG: hypothetical protein GXW85_08755 [Clostridia bacterium]|nr:hypothetical protein [Clostridia bacterium]
MKDLTVAFKNIAVFLKEEYHLCCYDPAMWLEKGTVASIVKLINGSEELLNYWTPKPVGNGPWSWPLRILTPRQVYILKQRFWKVKNVQIFEVKDSSSLQRVLNENNLVVNYIESFQKLYCYLPSGKEIQLSYYIDDFKSIAEFYEMIEEFFGRYVLLDVEKEHVFVSSSEGPYGSYTLAYDKLGRKGCRNYLCVLKCPVFPLDDHLKKLTSKIELQVDGLTSEVKGIIIYDMEGVKLASLNEEGEFE